ncbi:hypothetical protein DITRI_Ditri06bG0170000 [Diplodiscus trichospermus]
MPFVYSSPLWSPFPSMNSATLLPLPGEKSSEGIQLEYIAVFLAVLFPGALVAFDYDLLQALPRLTALRVYCAGIWHNAVFCAVCGLLFFLQPLILFPFYIHAEIPLVLDVAPASPLSDFLSPGDAIVSLDGVHIHNVQNWMEMTALIDKKIFQNSSDSHYFKGSGAVDSRKGYCVPTALLEDSGKVQLAKNQSVCPNDLVAFLKIHCFDPSRLEDMSGEDGHLGRRENVLCLNAKDIVKLEKCGDSRGSITRNGSSCMCSQNESCLSPVQLPGSTWVEITYSRPYATECLQRKSSLLDTNFSSDAVEQKCGGTFVFVGDVISMAHSVHLTEYQPRWGFFLAEYLPNKLEKSLVCTFHVSLTLALLNSLPVYFLDGESILEVTLSHFTSLSPRRRRKILQTCLVGGTFISVLTFLRIFFINFL